MISFLQRRKEGSPLPTAAAPAPPSSPSASLPLHHGRGAKSLPILGGSVDYLDASSGGGSMGSLAGSSTRGGRRGGAAFKLASLVALFMLLFMLRGHAPQPSGYTHTSFVTVEGTQFMLDCRPFYIAGFNVETITELARVEAAAAGAGGSSSGPSAVRELLGQAAAAGLDVVRLFAHTTDPTHPLQVEPGVYNEEVFEAIDTVIAEAERAGLRVILSLADNWKYSGGADEYVEWSTSVPPRDPRYPHVVDEAGDVSVEEFTPEQAAYENERKVLFYTDREARRMYRDHVRAVVERVNHRSGRVYRDDPTIMAFDLLNEPRCSAYETPDCTDVVSKWVLEMSSHFKSLDQRHLLTLGSEGFWGERDEVKNLNPGEPESDWASKSGQDFVANHALPQIDFAAFHLWEDNWNNQNQTFHRQWIDQHAEDCQALLKKPCVLEEFGKKLALGRKSEAPTAKDVAHLRDPLYLSVYDAVESGIGAQKGLAGSMYWRWGLDTYNPSHPGEYGVLPGHSTFHIISEHARRVRKHMLTHPPGQQCSKAERWVPASSLGGMLRRCEHRPSVCADHRARQQYQKTPAAGSKAPAQLQAHGKPVFASQEACCLPGGAGRIPRRLHHNVALIAHFPHAVGPAGECLRVLLHPIMQYGSENTSFSTRRSCKARCCVGPHPAPSPMLGSSAFVSPVLFVHLSLSMTSCHPTHDLPTVLCCAPIH